MKKIACFISIPKNGSKTIHEFLNIPDWTLRDNVDSPFLSENHLFIEYLEEEYNKNHKGEFENLFTFCFSRDPYDRAVSWFFYNHRWSISGNFPELDIYKTTFKEWVLKGCPGHFSKGYRQYDFIKGNAHSLDFIGKMETFEEDMKHLQKILETKISENGITWTLSPKSYMRKKNVSDHKHYKDYYDEELKEKVYEIFQKDFEFFGYKK